MIPTIRLPSSARCCPDRSSRRGEAEKFQSKNRRRVKTYPGR